ncbi:hypothetical protein [Dactylosporangium sp. NPDC006015]|uniref:hypothetical protein n=1 Tax=Dactylosporangium sp. NPDC006015 TaxID=3154576 RepID=UPI0033AAEBAD
MLDARGDDGHAPHPTDARRRGRPVKPVVGYHPPAGFAHRMRRAREADGNPSYQVMAQRVNSNQTTLSKADSGLQIPSWEHLELYLKSVNEDPSTFDEWRAARADAISRAARFQPDLGDDADRPAARRALRSLIAAQGVDEQTIGRRRAETEEHGAPAELPDPVPAAQRLRPRPLLPARWTDDELLWRLYLSGGTPDAAEQWKARLEQLPPGPPPWRRRGVVVPAVAAALVVLTVAGLWLAGGTGGTPARTGVAASGGPARTPTPPPPTLTPGAPAQAELDAVIAAIDPAEAAAGEHAHVDVVITTYGPPPEYLNTTSNVNEELDWSPAAPGRVRTYGTGATSSPEPLPPGPPAGAAGPPSADPVQLQRTLEGMERPGAAALLRRLGELCVAYPLRAPERIAVLRMLRGTPGLAYRGKTIADRLGLPGKAFSADGPDGVRETLVFDPGTGRLLVHESTIQRQNGVPVTTRQIVYVRSVWDDQPD